MKIYANRNKSESHLYFHTPSESARNFLFYPISTGVNVRDSGYKIHRERYDSFLIMHIVEGSLQLDQDGKHYEANEGEILLVDCYKEHVYFTDTHTKFTWLHFDGGTSRPWFESLDNAFGRVIKGSPESNDKILSIISGVKHSENEYALSDKIHALMCDIFSYSEMNVNPRHSTVVNDAKTYMEEHLTEDLTVKEIADKLNYSPSHFSKIFKDCTKMSPYEYLLSRRIELAKKLLIQTNYPLDVIAYKSGFHSVPRLICEFKKATTFTPLKFRKLHF